MKTLVGVLITLLLVLGIGAWLRHVYVRSPAAAAALAVPHAPLSVPGTKVVVDQGPVTVDGTVIMDTSSGLPAVPYVTYLDGKHITHTKQLVFADARACNPGAGDFPCVPSYSAAKGYPKLTDGQHIHAQGYVREDRFLVTNLTS